jgi:hypothetical protein
MLWFSLNGKSNDMKRIWTLLLGCMATAAQAQVVNINVNGNRNQQVIVNNVVYAIDNNVGNNFSKTITLTNLRPGEYSLQLIRVNDNNPNDDNVITRDNPRLLSRSATTFKIRPGYDVAILIHPNGIIQVKDKLVTGTTSDTGLVMTDEAFSNLMRDIQYQWRNTRRLNIATTAFTNNNNYFSSQQAIRIIQTVTGEVNRVHLAKLAYARITDRGNFTQVYNIMETQSSRDDLAGFLRESTGPTFYSYSESFRLGMNDQTFDAHLVNIQKNMDPALRINAVTQVLSNETNYFTVLQVRRLVDLVEYESSRLQLLRDVYTHVTDPENFHLVYPLLTTDAARDELITYVNTAKRSGGLINYNLNKPAMSEKAFEELLNTARAEFARGSLTPVLTKVFGDITYYFTSQQAALLISVAPDELSRLSLAKAAYRSVVDPQNYLPLMDQLLSSPLSKNELNDYAYSFRGM